MLAAILALTFAVSPAVLNVPIIATDTPKVWTVPELKDLAAEKAMAYHLSDRQISRMLATINCESLWDYSTTSPTGDYGIAQWNIKSHGMTKEQALDPEYALQKMASEWKEHYYWWVCYSLLYGK